MLLTKGIITDKRIHSGKPVIEGTRVPVALVLGKLTAGMTYEEVMQEYAITRDDILSVLRYAHKIVQIRMRPAR